MIVILTLMGVILVGALVNAGRNFVAAAIMNYDTPTFFDHDNSYLCVGDSSTAVSAGQTDLQAVTNKARAAMNASYPTIADNVLTYRATFGLTEANYEWIEWALANDATAGTILNRKVESPSLGTKTNAQSWVLNAVLTVGIGS